MIWGYVAWPILPEQYKYQILFEHLQHPGANKLIQIQHAWCKTRFHRSPSTSTELWSTKAASSEWNWSSMEFPHHSHRWCCGLSVHALLGMLLSLEGPNGSESRCGSGVDGLLGELPVQWHSDWAGEPNVLPPWPFNQSKSKVESQTHLREMFSSTNRKDHEPERNTSPPDKSSCRQPRADTKEKVNVIKPKLYCPYCNVRDHFLGSWISKKLSKKGHYEMDQREGEMQ